MSDLAKFTCKHSWLPINNKDICLKCNAFCVRDEKNKIWYYSYPIDLDWEGKIDAYEQ